MRASCVPFLLAAAIAATGCGTETYIHEITVRIDDPGGRLGPGPVQVSLFDHQMGSSPDWARKTMGTTGEGAPYTGTLATTRVRTFLSEDLPGQVVAALAIPAYTADGYFVVSIAPDVTAEKTIVAPFVGYGGPEAAGEVAPLPVNYTSQPGDEGWRILLTVEIPPLRSDTHKTPGSFSLEDRWENEKTPGSFFPGGQMGK